MNGDNESKNTIQACVLLGVAIIAALAMLQLRSDAQLSEILDTTSDERSATFEAEQFRIETELVGELRGRRENLEDPVAYIARLDDWFSENRARLVDQAALGAELDAAEPTPDGAAPADNSLEEAAETEESMLLAELRRLAYDETQSLSDRNSAREAVLDRLGLIESAKSNEARVPDVANGTNPEDRPAWLEEISRLRRADDLTPMERVRRIEHILSDQEIDERRIHNPEQ